MEQLTLTYCVQGEDGSSVMLVDGLQEQVVAVVSRWQQHGSVIAWTRWHGGQCVRIVFRGLLNDDEAREMFKKLNEEVELELNSLS